MRCISCVSSVILLVSRLFIISMYIFFRCPDISVIKENTFYYTCPSAPPLTSPGAFHCLRLICRDGRIPALLFFPLYGHRGEVLASAPLVKKKKKKSSASITQLSENAVIIPKSLHLGLLWCFMSLGVERSVLETCWLQTLPFICRPI